MWADAENWKKVIGVVTAFFAAVTGGYSLWDKVLPPDKRILEWAPTHFSISNGSANGSFKVVAARKKFRDDCSVEGFLLEVRDSALFVHKAEPSIAKFSGPAGDGIDKFAYSIKIKNPKKVAKGRATLLAHIRYKCPEGEITVNYPRHPNLTFMVE